MTTPHELLNLADNNIATADKLWAEHGLHRADGEVQARIAQANAQALLAIALLLHEHYHPQPVDKTRSPELEREHLDSLISEAERWGMDTAEMRKALADELEPRDAAPKHMVSSSATLISSDPRVYSD